MGHDLSLQPSQAKQCLGVVPQEINLNIFETGYQILINQAAYFGMARKQAKARALILLEQVDLLTKKGYAGTCFIGWYETTLDDCKSIDARS